MWNQVKVNIQNIKHSTEKAVLIALPHKSNFDGFEFWVSKKLIRNGSHSYEVALSVNDEMTFNIKRVSQKTYKVLAEKTISAAELIEAFA